MVKEVTSWKESLQQIKAIASSHADVNLVTQWHTSALFRLRTTIVQLDYLFILSLSLSLSPSFYQHPVVKHMHQITEKDPITLSFSLLRPLCNVIILKVYSSLRPFALLYDFSLFKTSYKLQVRRMQIKRVAMNRIEGDLRKTGRARVKL